MQIIFKKNIIDFADFNLELEKLLENPSIKSVCEIGAGANPTLDINQVQEKNLSYSICDISEDELAKAPSIYHKVIADVCDPLMNKSPKYNLVFSMMLAEHLPDAYSFHKNMFDILESGGYALHFFPNLYTLPFFINRITPQAVSAHLLNIFAPRDPVKKRKFPAYYHWCFGPTNRQIKKLTDIGYQIVKYIGFFGHDYYGDLPVISQLETLKTTLLLKYPNPLFTSYSLMLLQKP